MVQWCEKSGEDSGASAYKEQSEKVSLGKEGNQFSRNLIR